MFHNLLVMAGTLNSITQEIFTPPNLAEVSVPQLPITLMERELKFTIQLDKLQSHLSFKNLPYKILRQNYFPNDLINEAAAFVFGRIGLEMPIEVLNLKQARLRHSFSPDTNEENFLIGVKSSKSGPYSVERLESPICALSKEEFEKLEPHANAGYIEKKRYHFQYSPNVNETYLFEIDQICAAGVGEKFKRFDSGVNTLPFVTIDCELNNREDMEKLLEHFHNKIIFDGDLVAAFLDRSLSNLLSTRRIATHGMSNSDLFKICQHFKGGT